MNSFDANNIPGRDKGGCDGRRENLRLGVVVSRETHMFPFDPHHYPEKEISLPHFKDENIATTGSCHVGAQ